MSNREFIPGQCPHCGEPLQLPPEAMDATVNCPKCGQPVEVAGRDFSDHAPAQETRRPFSAWFGIIVVGVALAVAALYFYLQKRQHDPDLAPAVPLNTTTNPPVPVAPAKPVYAAETNEFGILPFKLETTPGSSLIYVTGSVTNLSTVQRFGVKVEFAVFDTNGTPVGTASDYQSALDPNSAWRFHALVIASKAVSAQFTAITEQK